MQRQGKCIMKFKYNLLVLCGLVIAGCNSGQSTQQSVSIMENSLITQQNLVIVKSTYEGNTSTENGKSLQRHVAQDVRWTEAAGFPLAGTYIGFPAIAEHVFKPLTQDWHDYRFVVEDYVASNNKVIAYGTYYGTYRSTNKSFEARVAHVWTLSHGKIISFEQFVDSVPVINAMK